MAGIAQWRGLMPYTVTIESCATVDSYGARTYQSCAQYRAAIQGPARFLHTATQQERVSRQTVYLASTGGVTTQDRITLPTIFELTSPQILQVQPVSDAIGVHHVKLFCG